MRRLFTRRGAGVVAAALAALGMARKPVQAAPSVQPAAAYAVEQGWHTLPKVELQTLKLTSVGLRGSKVRPLPAIPNPPVLKVLRLASPAPRPRQLPPAGLQ